MNIKAPRVSIVIPAYNQAQFLADAINSACDQNYGDFEIIIIDDGSTDNTRELISNFEHKVRYIYQQNRGLAGARNTGIRAAKGSLIGLLDADDQWQPNYLEVMVALADQNPETAVFYCCAQSMDQDGDALPQIFGGPLRKSDSMYEALLRANFLIPSTILISRDVVMTADLFDESLRSCEDWDLWLRILPQENFVGTSECLVRYRIHGDSLSTNPSGMQQATRAVIEKNYGPDDGQYSTWTWEKRRAYGGVFRYHVLTSAQRQKDWQAAGEYLHQALLVDPSLATDVDLFYDLAHGNQPPGYRGESYQLYLEKNAKHIINMLEKVFTFSDNPELNLLRRRTYGTANYALGLLAYQIEDLSLSRRFLLNSLYYRPDLWRDSRVTGNFSKSFLTPTLLEKVKHYKDKIFHGDIVASQ